MSRFQNPVAAEVTRLKHSENRSLLTSAATVLKKLAVNPICNCVVVPPARNEQGTAQVKV